MSPTTQERAASPDTTGNAQAISGTAEDTLHALLALARSAPNSAAYARALLPILGAKFASPCVALELRLAARVTHERWHAPGSDPKFWTEPVEEALTEAIAEPRPQVKVFKDSRQRVALALLSTPLIDSHGATVGAIALATPCASRADARRLRDELHPLGVVVGMCAGSYETARNVAGDAERSVHPALKRAADFGTPLELCFSIANNLRNKTGCERVVLGRVHGSHVRIECISGLAHVQQDSPSVALVRSALEECLDHGARIVRQTRQPGQDNAIAPRQFRLHQRWHESTGAACVASLPFGVAGSAGNAGGATQSARTRIVLGLQRASDRPFREDELDEIAKLVAPYVSALELVERAHRGLRAHVSASIADTAASIASPRAWKSTALVLAGIAAAAWIAFGTRTYRVSADGKLRPEELRHVSAPAEGILAEVLVRPGDRVEKGAALVRLDTRALELEASGLEKEIEVARLDERRAFAERDGASAARARAHGEELTARLDGLRAKIELATPRAPFDGVVLRGDLLQRVGSVVRQGEPLLELSPDGRLVFELEVDERRARELEVGMPATFSPYARPENDEQLSITRIAPAATSRDGRNVLVVEAAASRPEEWLRPGMEGVARIEVGERPVWWVLSHQAIDWLALHVWP